MQISVSLVKVIKNLHGIRARHAVAKYTTMDKCLTWEICREGQGMNLLTCFNIDLYRDALCKIGDGMHNDHRYSQLSSCAHAGNANRS